MALLSIQEFGGLRTAANPAKIEDTELSSLINFEPTDRQYLRKRNGIEKWATVPSPPWGSNNARIVGRFRSATVDQLLFGNQAASDGWNVNLDTGVAAHFASMGKIQHSLMYGGFSWIFGDAGVKQWDGTTVVHPAGTPNAHMGVVYHDRLFLANVDDVNSEVRFSEPYGNPGIDWLGASSFPAANYDRFDPGDGDRVVGLHVLNDIILVFKTGKIFAYYTQSADLTQWSLKVINASLGCISFRTILEIEGLLYFESRNGIYRTDGITFEEISVPVRDIFMNRQGAVGDLWNNDTAVRIGNKYVIFITDTLKNTHRVLAYDFVNQAWSEYKFKAGTIQPQWAFAVPDRTPWTLYMSNINDNSLYRYGSPTLWTDDGDSYTTSLISKYYDFGEPGKMKKMLEGTVEMQTTSGAPEFTWVLEDNVLIGPTVLLSPVTVDEETYIAPVKGPGYFRRVAAKVSYTGDQPLEILGLNLNVVEKRTSYARVRE